MAEAAAPPAKLTFEEISQLNDRKEELKAEHAAYVENHPELKNILADFMTRVLMEKPEDVKEFAAEHFNAFIKPEEGEGEGEGKEGSGTGGGSDEAKGEDGGGAEGDDGAAGDAGTASATGATGGGGGGGGNDGAVAPLVICGPSGVGKGTLIGRLMEEFGEQFGFSVSHTTRDPRPGEEHGVHYNFTDVASMRAEIEAGQFIEFAEVHKNLYGTSKAAVSSVAEQGRVCILDIDTQGVVKVKAADLAPRPRYLFIAPPSFEVLEARLRERGTEDEAAIRTRTENARKEMAYGEGEGNFDHTVVNDDLETAYAELKAWACAQYPHLSAGKK